RIAQVTELARPGRAGLDARRIAAVADSVNTEGALLDDALRTEAVAEVVHVGIHGLGRDAGLGPVETACAVGTCGHAAAAADAPVVVDRHDAVGLLPGGVDRAGLHARCVATVLAGDRKVEVPRPRDGLGLV